MIGRGETLYVAIVLRFRCPIVLEAVYYADSNYPIMACLELGYNCVSTRTLTLDKKLGAAGRLKLLHDIMCRPRLWRTC
jgi:hypothetical protein